MLEWILGVGEGLGEPGNDGFGIGRSVFFGGAEEGIEERSQPRWCLGV